jgi:2-amino-4-hydroxy-6-hydroxymethyldihydropteridine diphosphokinase
MRIGVALGSNLGDRVENLRLGRDLLVSLHESSDWPAVSPIYETEPVDCPTGSAPFLNAVVEIECSLDPNELLGKFTAFEIRQGRPATRDKNAPRQLDLDILYAGDLRRTTPTLTIPHPRLSERRFVLQPLADIRPSLRLPGYDITVAELLDSLSADTSVKVFLRDW